MSDRERAAIEDVGTRDTLIAADSLLSLIASRYAAQLPADLIAECREASKACRRVSERPLAFAEDAELNIECERRWGS